MTKKTENYQMANNLSQFDLERFAHVTTHPGADYAYDADKAYHTGNAHEKEKTLRGEVKAVVDALLSSHIDITVSYQDWLHLGFALANGLGEEGRDLYHQLSSMNAQYNYQKCDKKYTSCLRGTGTGITIRTFFSMAQAAGIDLPENSKKSVRKSHRVKKAKHYLFRHFRQTANCQEYGKY